MSEFDGLPVLRNPVAIAAFEGWNDAADASTAAVDASAASFQPSNAAIATGLRSTGSPSNSLTHPAYWQPRRSPVLDTGHGC